MVAGTTRTILERRSECAIGQNVGMTEHVSVSKDIAATPSAVWALVTELARMGEWSPEATGGKWVGGATGPALGAKFKGTNSNGKKRWSTDATVTKFDIDRTFAFDVKGGGLKVAAWTYTIEPTDGGCRVTESWDDPRGAAMKFIGKAVSGVADRASHNRAGMETTLNNLATALATTS